MSLYDAHQHFHFDPLTPHRAAIDADLRRVGLKGAVVNGTNEEEWPVIADLARQYDWIRPSYGLHPWDCGNRSPAWLSVLRAQLLADPHGAVGEIGLDRWIINGIRPDDPRLAGLRVAPLPEQAEVFIAQYALAAELNRPASIHCVQAWGALHDLLQKTRGPARGFLLHGDTGPAEMINTFTDLGAYYSFNIEVLDRAGRASPSAVVPPRGTRADKPDQPTSRAGSSGTTRPTRLELWKHVPTDRLLVETDAPTKAPAGAHNRFPLGPDADGSPINHPANILAAYEALAELRGVSLGNLTQIVEQNFQRLFG